MPSRRNNRLVVCACLLLLGAQKPNEDRIPSDLKIVARYYPGNSRWKSWRCTITADGNVVQEVRGRGEDPTTTKSMLSDADLRSLLAKVKEAGFSELKDYYEPKHAITDSPTLELTITQSKKTHEVSVYAPHFQEMPKNTEVKRFFKVWSELLRKVPSPNPEDQPENYRSSECSD